MSPSWSSAAAPWAAPALADDDVHVLGFGLDLEPGVVGELAACLAPNEHAHALQFHHERDRRRYAVGRARLRQVLAAYAECEPAQVGIVSGPHGKPALAVGGTGEALRFNLSHSSHRALLAVVRGREIGVDIEERRGMPDAEEIARRHFAPAEFEQWLAVAPPRRSAAFFSCWTRKEAYVKAVGGGLAMDLRAFEVSLDPDAPARLLSIAGSQRLASGWTLWSGEPWQGFQAAVAINGSALRLRCFELA